MRFARLRRVLGPLEPPLHEAWLVGRAQVARLRRRAVVVVALDGDHDDDWTAWSDRRDDRQGVWVCTRDDVAPLGGRGWCIVRLEPDTVATTARRREAVDRVVASWRRACRHVEVVDLGT